MQPNHKTQQLVRALALDFIHNKTFNVSILQLLCEQQKIHASTTSEEIKSKISLIDKGFQLLKEHHNSKKDKQRARKDFAFQNPIQRNFCNMVSIFAFNVSATNEHYINEIEKQMTQSTASQSVHEDLNKTIYKDKMALNILREHLHQYFSAFTEHSQYLQSFVSEIMRDSDRKITQSQLGLLETIDYLCVKYSIQNETSEKIVKILERNENISEQNSSMIIKNDQIKEVNKILFSETRQSELYQLLETNSHVNIKNLLSLITSNHLKTNPPRKIFNSAELSGKQAIQGIIVRLIKRIGKNELFNEKCEEYAPFRLIMSYFLNKHFSVYFEFNSIIKDLMVEMPLNSQQKLKLLQKIEKVFRIMIPIENPLFHHIIQFTYNLLVSKYSDVVAFQLIKKLLLNRFLLNPAFYVLYNEPDQQDIKNYVSSANIVRALFYPNKTEQLSQKSRCPELIKLSSEILYSLDYCLKKQKDSKSIIENSNLLYINDKILKAQMQQFYEQLKQSHKSPRQEIKEVAQIKNIASDYSLSFILVKNDQPSRNMLSHPVIQNVSEVQLAPNTNRSNANVKDNQSIRYMYEQLRGQMSHSQIPPRSPEKKLKVNTKVENERERIPQQRDPGFGRASELARKQHEISNQTRLYSARLPTDRQMIEEMVELRKQYGQLKRCLNSQCEKRKSRNIKRIGLLRSFSARFNHFKQEVEKDNNSLYVHMTTYA